MDSDTNNVGKDNDQRKKEEQLKVLLLRRVGQIAYLLLCLLYPLGFWISGKWISRISLIIVISIVLSFPLIDYCCARTFPKYLTLLFLITAAVMGVELLRSCGVVFLW